MLFIRNATKMQNIKVEKKGKEKYIRQLSNEIIIIVLLTDKINLTTKTNIRRRVTL